MLRVIRNMYIVTPMPKTIKRRNTIQKAFSFVPPLAKFIETRSKAIGETQSGYIQMLVEYDQEANVVAEALRTHAEKVAAA